MPLVPGILTDAARNAWPRMFYGDVVFKNISYVKFGEGGWVDPGNGRVPRTASQMTGLTNLDCVVNPNNYPVDSRGTYQKNLAPADFSIENNSVLKIRCFLDFGDWNDDGNGNNPEIWELGVFDESNRLVAYATFQKITKDNTKQLEQFVRIGF